MRIWETTYFEHSFWDLRFHPFPIFLFNFWFIIWRSEEMIVSHHVNDRGSTSTNSPIALEASPVRYPRVLEVLSRPTSSKVIWKFRSEDTATFQYRSLAWYSFRGQHGSTLYFFEEALQSSSWVKDSSYSFIHVQALITNRLDWWHKLVLNSSAKADWIETRSPFTSEPQLAQALAFGA